MKTNKLSYTASKNYAENGVTYRIDVKIQLADECKNGVCHWSITPGIREETRGNHCRLRKGAFKAGRRKNG